MKQTIVLSFRSLFSSYGTHSNQIDRDTNKFPTKSAYTGLCLNALGHDKTKNDIESLYAPRDFSRKFRFGVLQTSKEIKEYVDFQTAKRHDKDKKDTNSDIIHKHYLVNARFEVYLEGDEEDIEIIYNALMNPARCLYLGRKCCTLECDKKGNPILPKIKNFTIEDNILNYLEEKKEKKCPNFIIEDLLDNNKKIKFLQDIRNLYDDSIYLVSRSLKGGVAECFYPGKIKYGNFYYYTTQTFN